MLDQPPRICAVNESQLGTYIGRYGFNRSAESLCHTGRDTDPAVPSLAVPRGASAPVSTDVFASTVTHGWASSSCKLPELSLSAPGCLRFSAATIVFSRLSSDSSLRFGFSSGVSLPLLEYPLSKLPRRAMPGRLPFLPQVPSQQRGACSTCCRNPVSEFFWNSEIHKRQA